MKKFCFYTFMFLFLLVSTSTFCCTYEVVMRKPIGIVVENRDFTGEDLEPLKDNKCPKEGFAIACKAIFDNEKVDAESESKIKSVQIICNFDYSPEYPAGSDVTDLFRPYPLRFKGLEIGNRLESRNLYTVAISYPQAGTNSFTVIVTLEDETTFESTTAEVTFI